MPQAIQVTPEEREAIERVSITRRLHILLSIYFLPLRTDCLSCVSLFLQLEQMGFDHDLVLEVFFACNKNEELAANYLLDHIHEFEE